jgi:hypothetical protein
MFFKSSSSPNFRGYLLVCYFDDGSMHYLRNNLEKGKYFDDISFLDASYVEEKLHLIEEYSIDAYIKENIANEYFKIKIIVPVFTLNDKPFLKNPVILQ